MTRKKDMGPQKKGLLIHMISQMRSLKKELEESFVKDRRMNILLAAGEFSEFWGSKKAMKRGDIAFNSVKKAIDNVDKYLEALKALRP